MAIRSDARLGGSIPQMNRVPEGPGIKPLFHSVRDIALILDKTVKAGYGVLRAGTVMSICSITGNLYPYPETLVTSNNTNAKAYLVADATASTTVYVGIEDSYKFQVGDELIIGGDSFEDLGAIVSIDRTAVNGTQAAIVVTTAVSTIEDMTTAKYANVFVKSAGASTPFSEAAVILDADIDTGTGEFAVGALTSVVLSNAILYTASLIGLDAAAIEDLGSVDNGRFTILK